MGLPRSKYVREGQEGVYHCFARCVRRAFLYGFDPFTHQDFSHRKAWIIDRLKHFSTIFAVEVCAYAVMWNHYHVILRVRPDIAAKWSDREVAIRWLTLFPKRHGKRDTATSPQEAAISTLVHCPDRIELLRKRLCSLSWFMGRLNEFIAREANKEDNVKGRFWESRFKCQVLLDEAAIAACMVYVDLNPIRAGLAVTPEESDFTSIQERITAWKNEMMAADFVPITVKDTQDIGYTLLQSIMPAVETKVHFSNPISLNAPTASWLCPISSEAQQPGILPMTVAEYFDLVDKSGRIVREDKRGSIPPDLAPILQRIGARQEAWLDTISCFESKFFLAAGLLSNLHNFAEQIGSKWLKGISASRTAFEALKPKLA